MGKPSNDTSDAVNQQLENHGVRPEEFSYSTTKDSIPVTLPLDAVEEVLDTRYCVRA